MYRLQTLHADVWTVLDEREDEVFRGTLSECEFWLDGQENRAAGVGRPAQPRRGLRDWLQRWWASRRPVVRPLSATPRSAARQMPQRH